MVNLVHDTLTLGVMIISRKTEWLAGIMSLLFCCIEVFLSFFSLVFILYMYSVGVCWSPRMSPHQQGNPGRDADNGRGGGQANASFVLRVHFLQKQFKQSNKFFHNYDFRQHVNFCVF